MFGKILRTRSATASPAPQFHTGPNAQTAPKNPKSLVKKFLHVKNVFKRSSSSGKDADSQGTSHRLQGVPDSSQLLQGPSGVTLDDRDGFDERPYLSSPEEPAQTNASHSLSPRAQAWWQGATSSASPRSNISAGAASQLAPSLAATTPPATTSTPSLSVQRPTQPAISRSTLLLDASSLPAPQPFFATTSSPATTFVPPRTTFHSSSNLAPSRSNFAPKVSSLLVPPQSVATTPAASFSPAYPTSQRSTPSIGPRPTYPSSPSGLLAPPGSVATTPATETSPTFTSFQCSKPMSDLSPTSQLIAELQATAANLDRQYHECVRGMHSVIQHHVFPHTILLVNETDSAEKELKAIREQIAAVERDCGKFQALYEDECNKFPEAEAALEKAQMIFDDTEKEHAELQDAVHEMQWGQPVGDEWVPRDPNELYRDSTPSQPATEEANEEGGANPAAINSPQRAKKVVKSWDSQWEPIIAQERYSLPRAAPVPSQAPHATTTQESLTPSNDSEPQAANGRVGDARQAYTDYNGRPLLWGQLAPDSSVSDSQDTARSSNHA